MAVGAECRRKCKEQKERRVMPRVTSASRSTTARRISSNGSLRRERMIARLFERLASSRETLAPLVEEEATLLRGAGLTTGLARKSASNRAMS